MAWTVSAAIDVARILYQQRLTRAAKIAKVCNSVFAFFASSREQSKSETHSAAWPQPIPMVAARHISPNSSTRMRLKPHHRDTEVAETQRYLSVPSVSQW